MRLASATVLLAFACFRVAAAQSGWVENRYYEQRGSDSVVCGAPYPVFQGYGPWGQPRYAYYQTCRRMAWTSWYGSQLGYRWAYTGYGYGWVSYWDTKTWWTYTWYDFTRLA